MREAGGGRRSVLCWSGSGEKEQSKDPPLWALNLHGNFWRLGLDGILITPPPPPRSSCQPPSPQLSSSRLMSPCLAFVTDHPAPICRDYWLSSIMDCSEGQEGLIPMNLSCALEYTGGWVSELRACMDLFVC